MATKNELRKTAYSINNTVYEVHNNTAKKTMRIKIHTEIDKDAEFEIFDLTKEQRIAAEEYFLQCKKSLIQNIADAANADDYETIRNIMEEITEINGYLDNLKNYEAIEE